MDEAKGYLGGARLILRNLDSLAKYDSQVTAVATAAIAYALTGLLALEVENG